jgi:hypothetical protein
MVIFRARTTDNLPFKRFLVVCFFISKVGLHVVVDGYEIFFATDQIFPQNFCIGPFWNKYIPLYMDCVAQYITPTIFPLCVKILSFLSCHHLSGQCSVRYFIFLTIFPFSPFSPMPSYSYLYVAWSGKYGETYM